MKTDAAGGFVAMPAAGGGALSRVAGIVLTFWAGSLWTICGVVAPSLFAALDDRALAGRLAGRFFDTVTLIGVVAAALLFALTLTGRHVLYGRYSPLLVALTAALPVLSKLALSPLMQQARAAGDMARFGMLHGASAALFMVACVCALVVVWNVSRPRQG